MIKRSRPIAKVSQRMKKRMAEYLKVKRAFLKANRFCAIPNCHHTATDLHHSRGRSGTLLTDVRFFKALCRVHHIWAHDFPAKAKAMGLFGPWGKTTP